MREALFVISLPILFILSKVVTSSTSPPLLIGAVVLGVLTVVIISKGLTAIRSDLERERPDVFHKGHIDRYLGNLVVSAVFEIVSFGLFCIAVVETMSAIARLINAYQGISQ